ncbi:MAG: hypothetical protein ACJA1Z_003978 [Patiriisocius sp.]|jgi:hypothetical protein
MNGVNVFNAKELQESMEPPEVQVLGISGYNSNTREIM